MPQRTFTARSQTDDEFISIKALHLMPFSTSWYSEPKTAVLLELLEPLSWDEFHQGIKEAHLLVASVSHSVDIVVKVNAALPQGNPLTHFGSAFQRQPSNTGRVIIAAPDAPILGFFKLLSSITSKVYPSKSKVTFVSSLEEVDKLLD
jgi:hypothetical protein